MSIATRIESIEEHIGNAYDELQGLGADLTNVNKNIENISVVLDDIYDSMPQVSGDGTSLTLDDTRVGKIKSTLKGNTSQTGTPTPSSPIPVNVVSGDNAITISNQDGTDSNTYNIDLPVENLFEGVFEEGGWDIGNGQKQYAPGRNRCPDLIAVKPSTTYTISFENTGTCYVLEYGSNSDYLLYSKVSYRTYNGSFTTGANTRYITFYYIPYNHDFTLNEKCQLEQSSKANSYTPFGTTPIELCKIGNYKDYFYKDSDKWYLHKEIGKVVLNGSENIVRVEAQNNTYRFIIGINTSNIMKINDPTTISPIMSNKLIATSRTDTFTQKQGICYGMDNYAAYKDFVIYCDVTKNMTDSEFITWLSNNNVTVYYLLTTPTNTEITYQPLIDQLNLLEKAQSKENQTNISQVNNDLPFIISASALKEWSV